MWKRVPSFFRAKWKYRLTDQTDVSLARVNTKAMVGKVMCVRRK